MGVALPPLFAYWREFAARYVTALCALPEAAQDAQAGALAGRVAAPEAKVLEAFAAEAPPMTGGEYLTAPVLRALWDALDVALRAELAESKLAPAEFLKRRNPAWNLVGRVCFHLAENRGDEEAPFAFLATYTAQLSAQARAQHLPLSQALREYAGAKNKARLLSLLLPVQRAAVECAWVKEMVDAGEIYHPLRWTPAEALRFLRDVPRLESAGIVVRMPGAWRGGRPSRPMARASVGGKAPSAFGAEALLDFQMEVTLDGERLSAAEIRQLLAATEGLQFLRGRWLEVDREKLGRVIERFRAIERAAAGGGISFAEAMRLVAGAEIADHGAAADADRDWSRVAAGPWLAETLKGLRSPEGLARIDASGLKATLRPYQQAGLRWLYLLHRLGLGACLADDMGLGKTIQVLALLVTLKKENAAESRGRACSSHRPRSSRTGSPRSSVSRRNCARSSRIPRSCPRTS